MDDDKTGTTEQILNRHGSAPLALNLRSAKRDPTGMRRYLTERREAAKPEDKPEIWRALFRLYGLPDDDDDWGWPRDLRYEWLAGRLAAELFPRCGILSKPRSGGPSGTYQTKMHKRKMRLLKKFERWCRDHPSIKSQVRAAELFMKDAKNKKACAAAGFTKPRSFAQGMKELSSGTPIR